MRSFRNECCTFLFIYLLVHTSIQQVRRENAQMHTEYIGNMENKTEDEATTSRAIPVNALIAQTNQDRRDVE